jgi:hypothetical protein
MLEIESYTLDWRIMINRRQFVKSSAYALALSPLLKVAAATGTSKGGSPGILKGFIVSDAHFGWANPQQPAPQKQREMIAHIHERFPDLDVLIDTGDAHHGALGSKIGAATRDWTDIIANQSNQALFYYVPGNHEIISPVDGDAERRCARMGSMSYRPYYSFDIKGIHFVSVPELEHPVYVNQETLDWLRLDLEINRDKSTILLSHNNIKGTTADDNFMLGYRGVANSEDILNLIKAYPNVLSWMHGHNHDYVISKSHQRLFVSNGRIGGFNPKHNFKEGEPLGGIYFEITPSGLKVQCYSAEDQKFLDEDLGRSGRSQTLTLPTTLDPLSSSSYAFGHGGFVDGQKAAVYNYHASQDDSYSVVLAGTTHACINENMDFSDYTHREDNPKMQQWDVFGYQIASQGWPQYFEEKNELWRWLSPGVLLNKRKAPGLITTLHLPAPAHGRLMYYRAVPGKSYVCRLDVLSPEGGQQIELVAKAFSQEGTLLWEKTCPQQSIPPGETPFCFPIDLPDLSSRDTIYKNEMLDTEVQLAIEARFSALNDELIINRVEVERAGAQGTTHNPELIFDGKTIKKSGPLVRGQTVGTRIKKPGKSRIVVEGNCAGSHRLLWYCRQTNIDWQVRNAPVADHGSWLEIDAPTNMWSTDNEIVIVPATTLRDEIYVHRLKNIVHAKIWPVNRGNQDVSVEIIKSVGGGGLVDVCSPRRPASVTGASRWEYRDGIVSLEIPVGIRASVRL